MSTLRIYLFGSVHLMMDRKPEDIRLSRGIQELFVYLLLERHRTHSRERLAGKLWGNFSQERARDCLNTALWRLRRILEPEAIQRGTYLLSTPDGEIGFNNNSDYWLDIEDFYTTVNRIVRLSPEHTRMEDAYELEKAISLYIGDLLEGMYIDWVLREREHLRLLYLNSLAYLMACYKTQRDYSKSLSFGLKILEIDPLREEIHREVMGLYQANGQRALAVRQYERCREALQTELGILPMEETRSLHLQILTEGGTQERTIGRDNHRHSNLEASLQTLDHTAQLFAALQNQLQQTIQSIRNEIKPNQ